MSITTIVFLVTVHLPGRGGLLHLCSHLISDPKSGTDSIVIHSVDRRSTRPQVSVIDMISACETNTVDCTANGQFCPHSKHE
ncbi:hypothetical protein BDR07DRAFT_1426172 [Suillus spraguei]|nr:hypothetical protein BDR07DRAFT_1426172 [Suillus spraguei]